MAKFKSAGKILGILVIAAILGGALGHVFANTLPGGPVRDFFAINFPIGFNTFTLNLWIVEFSLGFKININFLSAIGVLVGYYIMRFSR